MLLVKKQTTAFPKFEVLIISTTVLCERTESFSYRIILIQFQKCPYYKSLGMFCHLIICYEYIGR